MAKYSKKAGRKVELAMRERNEGTLRSGRNGRKVTSRAQAIAIGLSEARAEGDKVPEKKAPAKKRAAKKKSAVKKRSPLKRAAKKSAKKKSIAKKGRPAKKKSNTGRGRPAKK
ncbi:MAG: DUF6496 domain-containing protein [Chitinophagaceae bacterium]